jgi:hypothetical protein
MKSLPNYRDFDFICSNTFNGQIDTFAVFQFSLFLPDEPKIVTTENTAEAAAAQ